MNQPHRIDAEAIAGRVNRLTLEELRKQNEDDQRIYGEPIGLVHLGQATQFAAEYILQSKLQTSTV